MSWEVLFIVQQVSVSRLYCNSLDYILKWLECYRRAIYLKWLEFPPSPGHKWPSYSIQVILKYNLEKCKIIWKQISAYKGYHSENVYKAFLFCESVRKAFSLSERVHNGVLLSDKGFHFHKMMFKNIDCYNWRKNILFISKTDCNQKLFQKSNATNLWKYFFGQETIDSHPRIHLFPSQSPSLSGGSWGQENSKIKSDR